MEINMQRGLNGLTGYTIKARNGELGKVAEFYFDDETWIIRYMVVETGNWLFNRKVLIPHKALGSVDWDEGIFHVNLTMKQVSDSPDIDSKMTISRAQEIELYSHYSYSNYWGEPFYTESASAMVANSIPSAEAVQMPKKQKKDSHLCSSEKIKGFQIQTHEGMAGLVADFIVDDVTWMLNFMVISRHNRSQDENMLISPKWIEEIDWIESKVSVNISKETIEQGPGFDPLIPVARDF